MSQWSNMFPIISGEPGEWSHETIFCWTGAWQNLSTWLSFHLHRISWTQRTMTGIHTVPQSRTQVQCDSPALRTEQLRAPAAFSLSPSGFIPKKETYTFLNGSPPASTLSFFVRVFSLVLPKLSSHLVSLLWCLHHLQRPTSGRRATSSSFFAQVVMLFSRKHAHSSAVSPSDDVSGGLVRGFSWRLRTAKWLWEPPVIPLFGMGPAGAQWKM